VSAGVVQDGVDDQVELQHVPPIVAVQTWNWYSTEPMGHASGSLPLADSAMVLVVAEAPLSGDIDKIEGGTFRMVVD
jgi:hypothetical protein